MPLICETFLLYKKFSVTLRMHRFIYVFFSFFIQSLRLRILLVCLHIIVIIIIIPYSEWTAAAARGQLPNRAQPWPAVLVHATRLVRNLSSAGTRARQELRDEKDLIDCLVWIIRIGVKSQYFDEKVSVFFFFRSCTRLSCVPQYSKELSRNSSTSSWTPN